MTSDDQSEQGQSSYDADATRSDLASPLPPAADDGPRGSASEAPDATGDSDPETFEGEEQDLREGVAALGQLSSRDLGLEELLTRVATYAVRAIPGADGAGLTLLEENRQNTVVATAAFVREVDNIQYSLNQGPCVSAAASGVTMRSGSLGGDQRWPQFGGRVARLGVHSVVSLPLITASGVVGAMNVYAYGKNVFDARAAELGELYAGPAAIAVQNAQILADAQRLVDRLRASMDARSVVDRAVGIMISRSGGTADEALERLRRMSQHEHRKLAELAQQVVDEAARRARARHTAD